MLGKMKTIRVLTLALIAVIILLLQAGSALASWGNGVIIMSHADYSIVTTSEITLSGTVSSNYNSSLTVNSEYTPISPAGTWSKVIKLVEGDNTITVRAMGTSGSVSSELHLVSTYGAPYITIVEPTTNPIHTTKNSITVKANVYNGETDYVLLDGVEMTHTDKAGLAGYNDISADISTLHPGTNNITFKAIKGSKLATKTITVIYDDGPVLTIDAPVNGSETGTTLLQVSVKTANARRLEFYLNGQQDKSCTISLPLSSAETNYDQTLGLALRPGENALEVRALDGDDTIVTRKTTSKTISVFYNPVLPVVYDLNLPSVAQSYIENVYITGKVRQASLIELKNRATGQVLQSNDFGTSSIASERSFAFSVKLTADVVNQLSLVPSQPGIAGTAVDLDITWQKQPRVILELPTSFESYVNTTKSVVVQDNQVLIKGQVENTSTLTLQQRGQTIASLGAGNFERWVPLAAGVNELTLEAKNSFGNTVQIKLLVPYTSGPLLNIVSPALPTNGASQELRVNQKLNNIIGNVARTSGLTIKVTGPDGSSVTYQPTYNSLGNFNQEITLYPGKNTVVVTATDGLSSSTKTLNYLYDDTPVIIIKEPLAGAKITENKINIKGRVLNTDSNSLYIDGNQVSFDSQGNFSYVLQITDPAKTLFAVSASNGARQTNLDVGYIYDAKPEVVCTSHNDQQTVYSNVITITGKIKGVKKPYDSIVAKINNIETTLNFEDGSFSKKITLKKGINTVTFNVNLTASSLTKTVKINY